MVWGKKVYFSRDATADWLFIFFFAVGTDMLANVALIHSLGSDVTRVHSHISLNISKFKSFFLKIVSYFSQSWSTPQVLTWQECTVTGINWATSCVQTPIKHLTASSPALSETMLAVLSWIWWGPVLQWILSFNIHYSCCQPQFSAFVCFCHESEIARQLDRKAGCGGAHGIHYLPRNCSKVVLKLSQSWLEG